MPNSDPTDLGPIPSPPPDDDRPGGAAWTRPVALAVSMLVIGFVVGWILRGDDGPVTVLPPATTTTGADASTTTEPATTEGTTTEPATTDDATTTDEASTTETATDTTGTEPGAPPPRADIALAVLNGTETTGLAGQNAERAEALGYLDVTAGNAPTQTGPSVVYYRVGAEPAAARVGQDLDVVSVEPLPSGDPLTAAAPADAVVILVLGPG